MTRSVENPYLAVAYAQSAKEAAARSRAVHEYRAAVQGFKAGAVVGFAAGAIMGAVLAVLALLMY